MKLTPRLVQYAHERMDASSTRAQVEIRRENPFGVRTDKFAYKWASRHVEGRVLGLGPFFPPLTGLDWHRSFLVHFARRQTTPT